MKSPHLESKLRTPTARTSLPTTVGYGPGFGFGDLRPYIQVPAIGSWLVKAAGPSQLKVLFLRLGNRGIAPRFVISLDTELSRGASGLPESVSSA